MPNTILGWSRNAVLLLLLLGAIFLTVIVGLLFLAATAAGAIVFGGGPKVLDPSNALLFAILVLLLGIFILLLILLRCCCRRQPGKHLGPEVPAAVLTALGPLLPTLPNVLRSTSIALYESGKALTWLHGNIKAAGGVIEAAGTVDPTNLLVVPRIQTEPITIGNKTFKAVKEITFDNVYPISPIKSAGASLKLNTEFVLGRDMGEVGADLSDAGKAIGLLAKALGAAPPSEVIA